MPKQQALLSPEKYIRTKARSIPIYECIVNDNWQEQGIASIYIARRHSNGNITYASYLVDTWCLGLKNTYCEFNADISRWNEIKEQTKEKGLVLINNDYTLMHNIIYGGIEFAGEYGLKPHKDFSLSQFILEEDDERIPLMDIEFGIEGKPHLVVFPMDDKAKVALKYLQDNFDKDDFTYAAEIMPDGLEDNPFEDEDGDDSETEETEQIYEEMLEKFAPLKEEIEFLYQKHFGLSISHFSKPDFNNLPFKVIDVPAVSYGKEIDRLLDDLCNVRYDDANVFMDKIKQAAQKYPHVPNFWLIAADILSENDRHEESLELLVEKSKEFPNEFYFVIKTLNCYSEMEQQDKVIAMGREFYPRLAEFAANGILDRQELVEFFSLLCLALTPTENIADSETCLSWLKYLDTEPVMIKVQELEVLVCKQKKLEQAGFMAAVK